MVLIHIMTTRNLFLLRYNHHLPDLIVNVHFFLLHSTSSVSSFGSKSGCSSSMTGSSGGRSVLALSATELIDVTGDSSAGVTPCVRAGRQQEEEEEGGGGGIGSEL